MCQQRTRQSRLRTKANKTTSRIIVGVHGLMLSIAWFESAITGVIEPLNLLLLSQVSLLATWVGLSPAGNMLVVPLLGLLGGAAGLWGLLFLDHQTQSEILTLAYPVTPILSAIVLAFGARRLWGTVELVDDTTTEAPIQFSMVHVVLAISALGVVLAVLRQPGLIRIDVRAYPQPSIPLALVPAIISLASVRICLGYLPPRWGLLTLILIAGSIGVMSGTWYPALHVAHSVYSSVSFVAYAISHATLATVTLLGIRKLGYRLSNLMPVLPADILSALLPRFRGDPSPQRRTQADQDAPE